MAKVTLQDVARSAGVSVATASKALNNRADISPRTRQAVLSAAARLGYQSAAKQASRIGRPLISVIVDSLDPYYAVHVIRGLIDEAELLDVDVVVHVESRRGATVRSSVEWEERFVRPGVIGVVLVVYGAGGPVFEAAARRGVPVLAIDPYRDLSAADITISATNWEGGKAATHHLIDLGHRRIALITGTEEFLSGAERLHGYRSALVESGIPFDDALCFEGSYTFGSGFDAAERMVDMRELPTAVFALNDRMALGAIRAFTAHGLQVPDDISVVGFDNSPGSELTTPQLTTIAQPLGEMGRFAARSLVHWQEHPDQVARRVKLATTLVVRETTSAPPG